MIKTIKTKPTPNTHQQIKQKTKKNKKPKKTITKKPQKQPHQNTLKLRLHPPTIQHHPQKYTQLS
ncbi:hypothetical protein BD0110_14040 [Helicobacter pylori]